MAGSPSSHLTMSHSSDFSFSDPGSPFSNLPSVFRNFASTRVSFGEAGPSNCAVELFVVEDRGDMVEEGKETGKGAKMLEVDAR